MKAVVGMTARHHLSQRNDQGEVYGSCPCSGRRLSWTLTENSAMLNRQALTYTTIACIGNFPISRPYLRSMACIIHAVKFAASHY